MDVPQGTEVRSVGSAPLDIPLVFGHSFGDGLSVHVSADGLFLFDFSSWTPRHPQSEESTEVGGKTALVAERMTMMNAYLCAFYSAYQDVEGAVIPRMVVAFADLLWGSTMDNPIVSGGSRNTLTLQLIRSHSDLEGTLPRTLLEAAGLPVSAEVVPRSFEEFGRILGLSDSDLQVLTLQLRAVHALSAHDRVRALVLSWTVSEHILNELWSAFLGEERAKEDKHDQVRFNKDRRKFLSSRTAATTMEFCELAGLISPDLYARLVTARRSRNDWLHDLSEPTDDEVRTAVEASYQLVNDHLGIGIPPGAYSLPG